jgi:hypothetical protein
MLLQLLLLLPVLLLPPPPSMLLLLSRFFFVGHLALLLKTHVPTWLRNLDFLVRRDLLVGCVGDPITAPVVVVVRSDASIAFVIRRLVVEACLCWRWD